MEISNSPSSYNSLSLEKDKIIIKSEKKKIDNCIVLTPFGNLHNPIAYYIYAEWKINYSSRRLKLRSLNQMSDTESKWYVNKDMFTYLVFLLYPSVTNNIYAFISLFVDLSICKGHHHFNSY